MAKRAGGGGGGVWGEGGVVARTEGREWGGPPGGEGAGLWLGIPVELGGEGVGLRLGIPVELGAGGEGGRGSREVGEGRLPDARCPQWAAAGQGRRPERRRGRGGVGGMGL